MKVQFYKLHTMLLLTKDIVDCYTLCVQLNLQINLSVDDMSLVTVQNVYSPYPQIVVTPYAFINALFPSDLPSDNPKKCYS